MIGALTFDRSELDPYAATHTVMDKVSSYDGVSLSWNSFPFVHIRTKETLWILQRVKEWGV
jgi:hypothetical protein